MTGGIGTEELTDFSTTFDITLMKSDGHHRVHAFRFEAGVDHYTSASSDQIDRPYHDFLSLLGRQPLLSYGGLDDGR